MKKIISVLAILCMLFTFSSTSFAAAGGDYLRPGETLLPGQKLVSANGRFTLQLNQGVLDHPEYTFITLEDNKDFEGTIWMLWWEPGSNLDFSKSLSMQTDGNLVAPCARSGCVWSTNTSGHPGSVAHIQDDGNFVVYSPDWVPLWSTGTGGH